MAFDQFFEQEWNPVPSSSAACFDCNICLEFAHDPVVTLCGHLYCWPCIYKWIDSQTSSLPSDQLPRCPVCKAETSEKTLVPLYGRGQSIPEPEHGGPPIPPRPPASGIKGLSGMFNPEGCGPHPSPPVSPNYDESNDGDGGLQQPTLSNLRGIAPLVLSCPVVNMEYDRLSGNSAGLYSYPHSYHSVRSRRRELRVDESLNRITIFLFCCFLSFLVLF
ncbi:E3 ubiquitin-protein ligase RMA1H1-like [Andrographis paniculata]|uniref:E3 ubiquitin-protein ligase RMA1H1-like n=1 Tax=Andrographis paniculata TaxID=175694 RepID=UPI0021E8D88A|nr:E3 ubiquitin-protein ligase RMA1H1-like [Andrographis paniculata]XP_051134964.1 E3 ubiquitin-protein ligase RMA1H1-like [Andrographis paniculata]